MPAQTVIRARDGLATRSLTRGIRAQAELASMYDLAHGRDRITLRGAAWSRLTRERDTSMKKLRFALAVALAAGFSMLASSPAQAQDPDPYSEITVTVSEAT